MENWIYIGIFLDDLSKRILKNIYHIPAEWKEYYNHMTVVYNDGSQFAEDVRSANLHNLGKIFALKVVAIGISKTAMAVKVELPIGVVCSNHTPHVTLGVSSDGKPVDSNNITNWHTISSPFYLNGEMRTYWSN